MTDPCTERIIQALKKSGYLMEQEVATQLENLGMHVETNWAFKDPDERKSREVDVRAIRRVAHNEEKRLSAFIEILVECKNSTSPFVFITREKNQLDKMRAPEELVFPNASYDDPFFRLGFDQIHYDFVRPWKAVQFCRIDKSTKNWSANHGGIYDSIFYPMAKSHHVSKEKH